MTAMAPPTARNSFPTRPDRSSSWLDGVKAGLVGGGVLSLPFAGLLSLLGGTLAGGLTNSLAGMGMTGLIIFGTVVLSWIILGTVTGALAGHLQVLRYQTDLTKLSVAVTFVWYFLGEVISLGLHPLLLGRAVFSVIYAGIFGTALGYMIGWADSTWFRPTGNVFEQFRRDRSLSTPAPSNLEAPGRRAPIKILPESPKGDPPPGHDLIELPSELSPLLAACKEGNSSKIEQALAAGEDLHQKTSDGELSALHIASISGVMEVASMLVSAGLPVDAPAKHGLTPLFLAAQSANINMMGFLLARGADLEHRTDTGYTPLHWACSAPHERLVGSARVKVVEFLLQQGANAQALTPTGESARDLARRYELKELGGALDRHLGLPEDSDHEKESAELVSRAE